MKGLAKYHTDFNIILVKFIIFLYFCVLKEFVSKTESNEQRN